MRRAWLVALLVTGVVGGLASTLVHNFSVVDPNINIEASKHRVSSTSGYWEDALVRFFLQGTGTAIGRVTVSTDDYTQPWARPENWTNNPNLYGGFQFSGSNFVSLFLSETYCWWGWHGGTYRNFHFLQVTNPLNFSVTGDAFAITADSAPENAGGQLFTGSAASILIEAARELIYHKTNTWTGAYFSANVTAATNVDVSGYTEGRYFHTTHRFPLAVPEMGDGGILPPFAEGFGFWVQASGGSIVGEFTSTYAYQSTAVFTNMIAGEAGIWRPNWSQPWQAWPNYPGNYPIYGNPIP